MRRNRDRIDRNWPGWRYSPDGEGAVFQCEADVPVGWTRRRGTPEPELVHRATAILDRGELVEKLVELGITINSTWGNAHMKRIIDGDVSPTW